jgi:hypothetical protein
MTSRFFHCYCHSSQPQFGRLGIRRAVVQEYENDTSRIVGELLCNIAIVLKLAKTKKEGRRRWCWPREKLWLLGFGVQPARKPTSSSPRSFCFTTTTTILYQAYLEQKEHEKFDMVQSRGQKQLPPNGVEPVTSALLVPRSTNWAKEACVAERALTIIMNHNDLPIQQP